MKSIKSRPAHRELADLAGNKGLTRRDFMGRAAALGLLPVAAQFWAGSAAAQTPAKGGLLRMGLDGGDTTDTLDPRNFVGTPHAAQAYNSIYDSLVWVKPGGEVLPALAESWSSNDDATVWTFNLRKGVTFHDGAPFTADDVVYSMEYLTDDSTYRATAKNLARSITSIEVTDPHTVIMTLDGPNFDFDRIMGTQSVYIIPKGKTDFAQPIGTGPYKVEAFEPGVRAQLSKYEGFWSEDEGHFNEVEIINIADASTRTSALRNGDVDFIYRPENATASRLDSIDGIELMLVEGGQHYTTPMRTGHAAFDSVDGRLAMKHGVRRQEFVNRVLGGFGYAGNGTPIGPSYAYQNEALEEHAYDPEKAKFHLEKAGLSASDLPALKTTDGAFSGAVAAAQLIQASLAEAGIDIDIERVPSDGYWSDVWRVEPWCFCYWNGSPTTGQQLSYYTTGNDFNDAAFSNARFDELVATAGGTSDTAKRAELYAEAQQILHDEGSTVFLGFSSFVHAGSSKLGHGEIGGIAPVDDHSMARRWWWQES